MTEFGPWVRRAGRYFGSSAEGELPGGDPAGRDEAGVAEPAVLGAAELVGLGEGDTAGRDAAGVAEGFTCTSAAKRAGARTRAAAIENQNLNMGSYATQSSGFRKINSPVRRRWSGDVNS